MPGLRERWASRLAGAPPDPRRAPLRRRGPGPRRLAAAGLLAATLAATVQVLAPDPPPDAPALAAVRDLPAGSTLAPGDVRVVRVPAVLVPPGALRTVRAGRVLVGAVRAGELLTDVRLVGPGLLRGQGGGVVGAPVRLADAAAAAIVGPGDRVDVLLTTRARSAEVVVRGVTVLARPTGASGTGSGGLPGVLGGDGLGPGELGGDGFGAGGLGAGGLGGDGLGGDGLGGGASAGTDLGGGLLVLAVTAADAALLAGAAGHGPLSITLR